MPSSVAKRTSAEVQEAGFVDGRFEECRLARRAWCPGEMPWQTADGHLASSLGNKPGNHVVLDELLVMTL